MTKDSLLALADAYAHCYAFVNDDSMPIARSALSEALDAVCRDAARFRHAQLYNLMPGWNDENLDRDIAIHKAAMKGTP